MADASVALAANNMKVVSSEIIKRLCIIVDKTSLRPTPTLDKHTHWDEITILARCACRDWCWGVTRRESCNNLIEQAASTRS